MKAATVHELKRQLAEVDRVTLIKLILRLARFKKENKELLTYLLFEADDEDTYRRHVKAVLDESLKEVPKRPMYYTKKSLRKVLRTLDKMIRFSGSPETEADLRIHFLRLIHTNQLPISRSRVLVNLYEGQIKKVRKAYARLHEDLQFDFEEELNQVLG